MAQPARIRERLSMPIRLGDLLAPYLEAGHDHETARALVEGDAAQLEQPAELAARWGDDLIEEAAAQAEPRELATLW